MELHQKLQELRRRRGLTQEELAQRLYVSRTAISKWESGRGVPSIDSLKAIAEFFSVSVDELLSSDELISIARADRKRTETHFRDLMLGLLDLCFSLFLFLPLFVERQGGEVLEASLLTLYGTAPYLKAAYYLVVIGLILLGIATLAMQACEDLLWRACQTKLSLLFGAAGVLLFMISAQPYASVLAFSLLAIKTIVLFHRH